MALIFRNRSILLFLMATGLWAQPKLRLSTTTVGPVTFAQGGVAAGQSIEARNAGTGNLNLTLTADVPWITAAVGASRPCTVLVGTCLPINLGFQSTTLARGTYTGTLTVRDPNAIDAPQFVTVVLQAGGGVPDRVDFYLPPNGGTAEVPFVTNSALQSNVTTSSGGAWLSLALDGNGTFRFSFPYRVVGRQIPSTPVGAYQGAITTSGSTFAGDNRTVPVTLNVTAQPIATASTTNLKFRIPQGGKQSQFLVLGNRGLGTLTVSGATFAPGTSGGAWLALSSDATNSALIKADGDAGTLAIGTYAGVVTVNGAALPGVTVALSGTSQVAGAVALSTVTDSSGAYRFAGTVDRAGSQDGSGVGAACPRTGTCARPCRGGRR